MTGRTVTGTFAEWSSTGRYEDFSADAQRKAVNVVFDSIGAMTACSVLPEVKAIVQFLARVGGAGQCSIIGHSLITTVVSAATANGAMAHGDEVDPVHLKSAGGHVAAGIVPTALTVAEWLDKPGKEVLRATVLGYDVGGRLMSIFYKLRDYDTRRFYPTAVVGNMSSAVTAGVLLGLNRQQMEVAMCLAAYQGAGVDNVVKDSGHTAKTFQIGFANRNGLTAALLAADGIHAPSGILDGKYSLFDAFFNAPDAGVDMDKDLGRYFSIVDVMHKRYPVGSPNQTYLQGVLNIIERHQVKADDIAEIEVQIPSRGVSRVPSNRHASISGLSVCAIAAATGKLDFYVLHDPNGITDPRVADMQKKIKFVGRDDWKGQEHGLHAIVTIRTRRGDTLREEVWHEPMTVAELDRKFDELVIPRLGPEKARRVSQLLKNLAEAASVRPLMIELRDSDRG